LARKVNWITDNLSILQDHLKVIYNQDNIDLTGFEIERIFIINTPTFYMFNGTYKAITLKQIGNFLDGDYKYPTLKILNLEGEDEFTTLIKHPYFKKP
jgi:hypothetical protein